MNLLSLFLLLYVVKSLAELYLSYINKKFCLSALNQKQAQNMLSISDLEMNKISAYFLDKQRFSFNSHLFEVIFYLWFWASGALGEVEKWALSFGYSEIITGLLFFLALGAISFVDDLFSNYFTTFYIEEKHGFNRQSKQGFIKDTLKGLVLSLVLGGLFLSGLLWIISQVSDSWWLLAWGFLSAFTLLLTWMYPTFLAPIFNKFKPIEEGDLKKAILELAQKVGFKAGGLFVMDASTRSTHGNAYFTGLMGEKRIVLFDNLLTTLSNNEIVAVLAHELGHFKLNHVRSAMIKSVLFTGLFFYALSLVKDTPEFYHAFALSGPTSYSALMVFGMWFSVINFIITPISSWSSRKNEFEADAFAKENLGDGSNLKQALIKLQTSNKSMPLAHPWYSLVYYSHPPILERITKL